MNRFFFGLLQYIISILFFAGGIYYTITHIIPIIKEKIRRYREKHKEQG